MKNPMILIAAVVVIAIAGVGGYMLLSKEASDDTTMNSTSSNSTNKKDNASNFEKVKEEKLEGKLVSSFPDDQVPLYPGTIESSLAKMDSLGERAEWNVAVVTTDSIEEVDVAIREAYEEGNWSIATDSKTGLGGTMLIARSNKHTATITYDDMGDEGILINYGVSQR